MDMYIPRLDMPDRASCAILRREDGKDIEADHFLSAAICLCGHQRGSQNAAAVAIEPDTVSYMNNARTIAALEKTIAQLTAIKDRLAATDAKAGIPAKKSSAKKSVAKKAPAKTRAGKKTV